MPPCTTCPPGSRRPRRPARCRKAAHDALDVDKVGYTNALGIPPLRAAIAGHYAHTYGVTVDPDAVAVTTGSSGGFLYAFLAAFEAGDTVVMARPGYPAYRNMLSALGCRVVELPCGPQTRFQPTMAQLDALDEPPAGLVIASPANPTGTMLAPERTRRDRSLVRRSTGPGWSATRSTTASRFGERPRRAWRTSRRAIVVNSFSKYFCMTGWRIGWLLVPDELRDAVDRLAGNFTHLPAGAVAAGRRRRVRRVRRARRERRAVRATTASYCWRSCPRSASTSWRRPTAPSTSTPTCRGGPSDSLAFAARALDECGVAVAPGVDFDPVDGRRFIRMCFAGDGADIDTAVDLFGAWLARQPKL